MFVGTIGLDGTNIDPLIQVKQINAKQTILC